MDLKNTTPPLCTKGCGFYGSKENKNMCSKCYNDFLKIELIAESSKALDLAQNPPVSQSSASSTDTTAAADCCAETASTAGACGSGSSVENRCKNCNKKFGLIGFKCRCGHMFCGPHRYPKEHECTFDFKKFDREILVKENPLLKADKLEARI